MRGLQRGWPLSPGRPGIHSATAPEKNPAAPPPRPPQGVVGEPPSHPQPPPPPPPPGHLGQKGEARPAGGAGSAGRAAGGSPGGRRGRLPGAGARGSAGSTRGSSKRSSGTRSQRHRPAEGERAGLRLAFKALRGGTDIRGGSRPDSRLMAPGGWRVRDPDCRPLGCVFAPELGPPLPTHSPAPPLQPSVTSAAAHFLCSRPSQELY